MADTMIFLHEGSRGFPQISINIFDENTNNYCFIWVPMANTMTFLLEGIPLVPVDFKNDLFYVHTNNYCFLCVPMADTMIFLHEGFPWVPVDFDRYI